MKLLAAVWRNGTARGIACLLAMVLLLRWSPHFGVKLIFSVIVLTCAFNLFRELQGHTRPVRTLYTIYGIRTRRFIKRLKRVPPEVPFIYRGALAFGMAAVLLMAFGADMKVINVLLTSMGVLIAIAALRQGAVAIRTLVKLTWSRIVGKIAYGAALSSAVWLGHGDATSAARMLTHADAKYFPTFVRMMTGPYAVLRMLQFTSLLIAVCATLLFAASIPFLIRKMIRDSTFWPRKARNPRNPTVSQSKTPMRDEIAFMTAIGLLLVAVGLAVLPGPAMAMLEQYSVPAKVLAETEYVNDGACKNIAPSVRTQHLGDNRVSVLTYNGRTAVFSQARCENPS